ncbi:MAG: CDP-diacylglycerol--serine O-phosphatidyltransferase [Flavobacteriales bacterium]
MKQLPNMITLGNLLCGSAAVVLAMRGHSGALEQAGLLIFFAAILDFFDGMVARLVGADSAMGRELDSLADVVSFGLAPSVLVLSSSGAMDHTSPVLWLIPFLLVIGAAWRLARFNIDTEQTVYFKGLPAPANGIFWASAVLWHDTPSEASVSSISVWGSQLPSGTLAMATQQPEVWWLAGCFLFFVLMVSKLKLLNFKPKGLGWKGNESRYVILAGSVISLAICQIVFSSLYAGIVLSLLLYLIVSLIHYYILKPHEIQSRN